MLTASPHGAMLSAGGEAGSRRRRTIAGEKQRQAIGLCYVDLTVKWHASIS